MLKGQISKLSLNKYSKGSKKCKVKGSIELVNYDFFMRNLWFGTDINLKKRHY